MDLTIGIVTDLHFGPEARWNGKLRKLTHHAPRLTAEFVRAMNDETKPDLVVNLGDDIEDESHDADIARYSECQALLRGITTRRLVNVAGNHDTLNIGRAELNRIWQRPEDAHLYDSFDLGGWHLTVLHTAERQDKDVRVAPAQIAWLEADLRATTLPTIVLMHHSASEQNLDDSRWFAGRAHVALVEERATLRRIFEESGKVRAVFNGHLHRNHLDVIAGIPYVTIQSLIENLDDDAPGRASAAHAIVRLSRERIIVAVRGNDPARYQFEIP